mgnify:CR=1 FL=1
MSKFFQILDSEKQFTEAARIPVNPAWRPPTDFVICRDLNGVPTAVYGGKTWDLNPVRLKANVVSLISFDSIFDEVDAERASLVEEVRYLLFCLYFYVRTGKLGRLSVTTLIKYFIVLRIAARYCYDQKSNPLIGVLSLQQLFSNPAYLDGYSQWIIKNDFGETIRKGTRSILTHMVAVGEQRLGYKLHGVFHVRFGVDDKTSNQTPIIPTRIYLGLINSSGDWLDLLYDNSKALEAFLKSFENPLYGRSQKTQGSIVSDLSSYELDFQQALLSHHLENIFSDDLSCGQRNHLSGTILKIQWILTTVIHLYTGMRDQEVMRLPYNCVSDEEVIAETVDDQGITRDKPMIVQVLSTTTKFTGYRKAAAWLATDEVVRAIEVARCICRGLSALFKVSPEDMPLFLTPAIINYPDTKIGVSKLDIENKPNRLKQFDSITEADFQELQASDPGRDFSLESKFQIGSMWPFATHQFRRSLAFYGRNSGFVSLPTLRKQFKHLTTQMIRYYGNNFERLKTIFGYYDPELDDFILPKNHVLFEYQAGVPMSIAYDLLDHAFGSDSPIFGGTGTYISNQRKKMEQGDIHIVDVRKDTEKLAAEGKISCRPTLLGACTYAGKCESYLLGDAAPCTSCADGIIEKDKLERAIADNEADLALYEPGSGEYQVVKAELDSLKKYHQKFIAVVKV